MSDILYSHPVNIIEVDGVTHLVRGSNRFVVEEPSNGIALKIIIALTAHGILLDELLTEFSEKERSVVRSLVDALLRRKILTVNKEEIERPETETPDDIFYWHFSMQRSKVEKELVNANIVLVGINTISLELTKSLVKAGMKHPSHVDDPLLRNEKFFNHGKVSEDKFADFNVVDGENVSSWNNDSTIVIVCSEFGTSYPVRAWNQLCVEHKIRMLPVVLRELRGLIGPLYYPGSSSCYECLIAREQSNSVVGNDQSIWNRFESVHISNAAYTSSMIGVLANIVVGEVAKIYTGIVMAPGNELINVALIDPSIKRHPVHKVPRCPHCSPTLWRPDLSIVKDEFKNKIISGR